MNNPLIDHIDQQVLGQENEPFKLNTREDFRAACVQMASQSRNQIDIFTNDLDPALYDQKAFIQSVKWLCLNSRTLVIRILLKDNTGIQKKGHRLIELAQKLTSKISIHRPLPDHIEIMANYMIVDKTGYILRNRHQYYDGVAEFNNRLFCKKLSEQFNQAWEQSEEDIALRHLHL